VLFDDETEQTIDFRPVLRGDLFAPLRHESFFRKVRLDEEFGTLVWPNDADFDPATLHDWPEAGPALARLAARYPERGGHRARADLAVAEERGKYSAKRRRGR
jgi:hypothetical protein